jgi:pyridoxal phosphate enzyme (YggS family)
LDTIRERYEKVLGRINFAAQSSGRDPDSIRLVVVTKLQPVEIVHEAIAAGARFLGENYADEAVGKMISLQMDRPKFSKFFEKEAGVQNVSKQQSGVQWHIIGHVQSRKARLVCEYFDYLHSLDSLKLAQRLDSICMEFERVLPVLLEFNVSGEQSKSGWPAWNEAHWTDLLKEINPIVEFPHLRVEGLMTMPPFFENPEDARPFFKRMRKLQEFLARYIPRADWKELSMGMSGDYEVAVQEGATWVRIGQAILGPRYG